MAFRPFVRGGWVGALVALWVCMAVLRAMGAGTASLWGPQVHDIAEAVVVALRVPTACRAHSAPLGPFRALLLFFLVIPPARAHARPRTHVHARTNPRTHAHLRARLHAHLHARAL